MVEIRWRVHLRSAPERVWSALATDTGRAGFWAESTVRRDDVIEWVFPNGARMVGRVHTEQPPQQLELDYFGDRTTMLLTAAGDGGTDLELLADVVASEPTDTAAGWVSVLLALKAYVDHGIDLRNHDPSRTWDQRYCDN